jgi:hypothetical protein
MKKIGMLLFAGLLVACNSKSKVSDQETVADNEGEVTEEVVEPGISDEVKNFTSPDLAFNMLHSKVDYVVTTTYSAEKKGEVFKRVNVISKDTVQFDSQERMILRTTSEYGKERYVYDQYGKLIKSTIGDTNDMRVKRDANNYITSLDYIFVSDNSEYDDYEAGHEYKWENGLIKTYTFSGWEWTDVFTYEYDANGFVSVERFEDIADGQRTFSTIKYKYTAIDERNNWIERIGSQKIVPAHYEFKDDKEVLVYETTTYNYYIDVRQIVYQK